MRSPRRYVLATLAAASIVVAGSACSSDTTTDATASSVTTSASASASAPASVPPATLVGPDAFAARMAEPDVVTINVHIPDEGSIAGTDLTIAFDEVATSTELPEDLATPLAVYCKSDNMSGSAVKDLAALGYTDVVELEGGFDGWVEAGKPLEPPAA